MKSVISAADDIRLVGEGACGADALRLAGELQPDVLVLDLNLPDINGLEVARRLNQPRLEQPKNPTAILILTVHREYLSVFELLECGVLGYVLKDEALETLTGAIRAVAQGENWLSPAIATQVVRRAVGQSLAPDREKNPERGPDDLTPREIEVLCLLAQGLDNTAIASRLVLTTRTVQNHVSNIYSKLAVASRTEAALYAMRRGLVQAPQAEE